MNQSEIQEMLRRRENMKSEGKLELPLDVDPKRYIFAFLSVKDTLILLPFLLLGAVGQYIYWQMGYGLSTNSILIFLVPFFFMIAVVLTKHPMRKNISLLKYRFIWRLQFNRRQKQFFYSKEGVQNMKKKQKKNTLPHTSEAMEIRNITSECFETKDDRLVKVIEASHINLSLMSNHKKNDIYDSFAQFLEDLPPKIKVQFAHIAQPINLKSYYHYFHEYQSQTEDNIKKQLLNDYLDYVDDIQKSRNMVSKKIYLIIGSSFTNSNKEKVMNDLEERAQLIKDGVQNMLTGDNALNAHVLDNDELFQLIHMCIDYENAQITTEINNSISNYLTVGQDTGKEMLAAYEKELKEKIR